MSTSDPSPAPSARPSVRHRLTGVWGVLLVTLVVGALALLVPSVRAQAGLSFTRQGLPFVELSAVTLDESHVGTTCVRSQRAGTASVTFSIGSHLEDPAELAYRVRVSTPTRRFGRAVTDRVSISPGETRVRVAKVEVPADRKFSVQVRLLSTDQYLLFHCPVAA